MPRANVHHAPGVLVSRVPSEYRVTSGRFARVCVTSAATLSAWLICTVGRSQPLPVLELRWEAPPQCPQGAAVQERIRALVGGAEVRPDLLRAEGTITLIGDTYRLALIVRSGSAAGVRMLESGSCDDLTGAAAVGLGLLVRRARTGTVPLTSEALGSSVAGDIPDSPVAARAEASSGGEMRADSLPPNTVAEAPPPLVQPSPQASASAPSRRRFAVTFRVPSLALDVLTLPGVSSGYALGAGAKHLGWEAFATFAYYLPRKVENQWAAPGADVARYALHLNGCREWRLGAFEGGPCLHTGLTRIVASGTGQGLRSVESTALVWSAGAALDGKVHVAPWFAVFITAAGELQSIRPRLVNEEIGDVYRFPLIGLRFVLGSEWLF